MKKVLSIALATMMLVSIFAVNASAMISLTRPELVGKTDDFVMVEQDFSDAEKTDFTTALGGWLGKVDATGGCATLTKPASNQMSAVSSTPITAEKWTVEFDVRRNSDLINTEYYGVFFGCQKAAYEGDTEKAAKFIDKYGIYLPLKDKDKDVWYTYRITFDETKASTDLASTIRSIVPSAQYKKEGDAEWTTIQTNWVDAGWNVTGNQSRVVANKGFYAGGETSFVFASKQGNLDATEISAASFSLDNIKMYVPGNPGEVVDVPYPLTNGTIHLTKEVASVPDATSYASYITSVDNYFTTPTSAVEAGKTRSYTVTFDAKNTVQGLPLFVHVGGYNAVGGIVICPTEVIGDGWFSYKLVATETAGSGSLSIQVYRKPLGSDGAYVEMTVPWKLDYVSGDEFMSHDSFSGTKNTIRLMYDYRTEMAAAPGSVLTETVWEVSNLQVTDEAAISGDATASEETLQISVDAEIIAATGDAGVALAVYDDQNRLYDVAFTRLAGGTGDLDLTAEYLPGFDANLFVWDYAGGAAAPLVAPIDVAAIVAE